MILNEKQCSKNSLNLLLMVLEKLAFFVELPQTNFQNLLCYIVTTCFLESRILLLFIAFCRLKL